MDTTASSARPRRAAPLDGVLDRLSGRIGAHRWVACWEDGGPWASRSGTPSPRDEIHLLAAPRLAAAGGVVLGDPVQVGSPGDRLVAAGVTGILSVAQDAPEGCVLIFENPDPARAERLVRTESWVDLGDIVSLVGLALRTGRRVEELPPAAAPEEPTLLQERARLASVIHEGITQVITNVAIQLEVLDEVLDDPERARAMTRSARTAVLEALDSLRTAIFELAPPAPEWGELASGLARYVADVEAQWGLDIGYSVEGVPREVRAEALGLAFAFAQETLTNLRKHAGTTAGEMRLIFESRWVVLTLCDRGVGFEPGTVDDTGFRDHQGLALMTTRARLLGGRFEVRSSPGRGTCVSLRLPF